MNLTIRADDVEPGDLYLSDKRGVLRLILSVEKKREFCLKVDWVRIDINGEVHRFSEFCLEGAGLFAARLKLSGM